MIELEDNTIKLRHQIHQTSTNLDREVSLTLYVSNIHPDTKDIHEFKTFLSEIFLKSPIIYHPRLGLQLKGIQSSPTVSSSKHEERNLSHFELKRIRLKPVFMERGLIDGQTVGSTPGVDRYQKRDGRVGFIDICWKGTIIEENSNYLLSLEDQTKSIAIELLNRKVFRGKKIKATVAAGRINNQQ